LSNMNDKKLGMDYLSINEFAELVGMPATKLRHYDTEGVFMPAKRGDEQNSTNKHRLYAPTQITTVKYIRVLSEIGVPLKTIKDLAHSRTPEKLLKLLSTHKAIIADKMVSLQQEDSVINTFMALMFEGICATETDIKVSKMPAKSIILGDTNDFTGSDSFHREFIRFCHSSHEPRLNLCYPVGGYFESMDVFLKEPSQPTRFFSLDPSGQEQKAEGLYLIGHTRGYYGQANDLPERMAEYAKENGFDFNGPVYNIFLFDEVSIDDPEQYLMQVSASVKETQRPLPVL